MQQIPVTATKRKGGFIAFCLDLHTNNMLHRQPSQKKTFQTEDNCVIVENGLKHMTSSAQVDGGWMRSFPVEANIALTSAE